MGLADGSVVESGLTGQVVRSSEFVGSDLALGRDSLPCICNAGSTYAIKLAAHTSNEFGNVDETVVILIEVLEHTFEFGGSQVLSILLQDPLNLVAVEFSVLVSVETLEQGYERADTVGTLILEDTTDFLEDLVRGLTNHTENGVHIGVVSSAAESHLASEFFKVKLTTIVGVELIEDGSKLVFSESASNSLHGLFEFSGSNHTTVHQVEVLEETLGSFALIVSTMSALANLFEDDALHLGETLRWHSINVGFETPRLAYSFGEVGVLLPGQDAVEVKVIIAETFLANTTIFDVFSHTIAELSHNNLWLLLAGSSTGVFSSAEALLKVSEAHGRSTASNTVPSVHNNGTTLFGHVVT